MNKLLITIVLSYLAGYVSAQSMSKDKKDRLANFCDRYTEVKKSFYNDSLDAELEEMVTDSLFSYFKKQRQYFELQDVTISHIPIFASDVILLDSHYQCQMANSDTFVYAIDLRDKKGSFEIYGYGNEPYRQKYYDFYEHLVDSIITERVVNVDIDSAVARFIRAYIHFAQTGSTEQLIPLSIGIDFDLIKLDREVDSLEDRYFKRRFKIREFEKTQRQSDTTAICEVRTTSGSADFELIKIDSVWLVTPVNDLTLIYSTQEELIAKKKRLLQVQEIAEAIESFDSVALEYLKDRDLTKLKNATSTQISWQLNLFQKQIGVYKPEHIRLSGLHFNPSYTKIDFNASFSEATITLNKEVEVVLAHNNMWRVVSIDLKHFKNDRQWMHDNFQRYIKLFGAYLYPYDDGDMEVMEIVADGEEDSSVLDQLTKFKIRPKSTIGSDLLFARIDSLCNTIMTKNPLLKPGTVYLDFIVEKNGKYSDVKIASSSNEVLNAYAIHMLNDLPNWVPALYYNDLCRARFVIPIEFARR